MKDLPLCRLVEFDVRCQIPAVGQTSLCAMHANRIDDDLLRIAQLWPHLQDAIGSGLRLGSGSGGGVYVDAEEEDETRPVLPTGIDINETASQAAHTALTHMFDMARLAPGEKIKTGAQLARRLAGDWDFLRWFEDAATEFHADRLAIERVVDRPPDMINLGVCVEGKCRQVIDGQVYGTGLMARPDDVRLRCWKCGHEYDVEDRRKTIVSEALDAVTTVPEMAKFVMTTRDDGTKAPIAQEKLRTCINNWIDAKRLTVRGHIPQPGGGKPQPTFLVREVQELLDEFEQRRQRKATA